LEARLARFLESLLTPLCESTDKSPSEQAALRAKIAEVGSESAPLLVAKIDPGPDADSARVFCARQIALALAEISTRAVTGDLLAILAKGTPEGRRNAAHVLSRSSETDRACQALLSAYQTGDPPVQEACLVALARLGHPEGDALLSKLLSSHVPAQVQSALNAIATFPRAAVFAMARDLALSAHGSIYADSILKVFAADHQQLDGQSLDALLQLGMRQDVSLETRTAILESLGRWNLEITSEHKRVLEPIAQVRNNELRHAGLVLLTLAGDRSARRELLREYDELVESQPRSPKPYTKRGEILYRIRDYSDAIVDYRQALKIGRDDPVAQAELYVAIARCYARWERLKDAAQWLRDAPISLQQLEELATDPDFRGLAESRYGDVFGSQ
jgi:tetratricopeptide (TPR) repeat protein